MANTRIDNLSYGLSNSLGGLAGGVLQQGSPLDQQAALYRYRLEMAQAVAFKPETEEPLLLLLEDL